MQTIFLTICRRHSLTATSHTRGKRAVTRPWQGMVKLPFYLGKGVEVESKGKDMTMG